MLLRFEAECVGETLGGISRRLEDGFNNQHPADLIRLKSFRNCVAQVRVFWFVADGTGPCLPLSNDAGLEEVLQPGRDRGHVTSDHIVEFLATPVSQRLSLYSLQDLELLDALNVIADELYDYWR